MSWIFILILAIASIQFAAAITSIRKKIALALPYWPVDQPAQRWTNLMLIALGQGKMFTRPIPALLHLMIYVGFVLINIEVAEIILDGILGEHRLFAPYLGDFYPFLISFFEFLAVLVLIACIFFLTRRNILYIKRLRSNDLAGWPRTDANFILLAEIILILAILGMNAADLNLQLREAPGYHYHGSYAFSSFLAPLFDGLSTGILIGVERTLWWVHIIGILAFLNYLPFSKHLHIIFAFPNVWYASLKSSGAMRNMPAVEHEVKLMVDPSYQAPSPNSYPSQGTRFGAYDVTDLRTTDILGAYSCTECGRCTSSCPANITGKKLSPRHIMMATRDRAEELGNFKATHPQAESDDKGLLDHHISREEILACNSCQACVEVCPISIDPLAIINQIKRFIVMEDSKAPSQWNTMFNNIENNMAPWQFSPSDRFKWADAE